MSGHSPTPSSSHSSQGADDEVDVPIGRDDLWLSTSQVSQRLQIPVKTLTAWASAGSGPRFARMGRYRRYRLSDLLAWEQRKLDDGRGGSPF